MDSEEEWIPVILYCFYNQNKTNFHLIKNSEKTPISLTASSDIKIKQTGLPSICQDYTDGFSIQNKIRNAKSKEKRILK